MGKGPNGGQQRPGRGWGAWVLLPGRRQAGGSSALAQPGKCCIVRVPHYKETWSTWTKAQKPVGSPEKSGVVCVVISL